ncbi:hypothetical protein [Tenggerimyces flavus]|uniref:Uncharacterized protein n=1 Tax=Tenggerimyces flavus TaxID=1708749 RepID=A0ABV7YF58_9ACTN|nr:hypothetical protein [Tenggerimyces flavus]MBM7786111.1 hypothetical protein [Tenggerimyces flavus]
MPQLVTVRVNQPDHRPIRIWVPVLPIVLLLSPFLILALLAAAVAGQLYRVDVPQVLDAGWRIVCALPGTQIDVHEGRTDVLVTFD